MVRPILSRILCAAAELADVSVGELATLTGLNVTRVSKLRSGVLGDIADLELLLRAVGVKPDTQILRLGRAGSGSSGAVEELVSALVLSFDRPLPPVGDATPRIACDRLALTLRPAAPGSALIEEFFRDAKPLPTEGNYKQCGRADDVWIGVKLRWLDWAGARIDFNPSRVTPAGLKIVKAIVAESRRVHFSRFDVAVDLPVTLRGVQAIGTTLRKATGVWNGSSVETIYVGSHKSRLSFAIYDRNSKLQKQRDHETKVIREIKDDDVRFEARFQKQHLVPASLPDVQNPFDELRLLWLDGEGLSTIDRVLLRWAQLVGFPLVERQLPPKRREKLREHVLRAGSRLPVPHPREVFDAGWRAEAERVLALLGLEGA